MKEIILATVEFIKNYFATRSDGRDFYHAERVYRKAMHLSKEEKANNYIVALAALLHGVDSQTIIGEEKPDCPIARNFLVSMEVEEKVVDWVCDIICNMYYENYKINKITTIEAKVVQDADLLDSIGAVGIARAFAFGGYNHKQMYDGNIQNDNMIKFFYDKLLLLKDQINTSSAKELAERRHEFMERFLQEFYYEWNI